MKLKSRHGLSLNFSLFSVLLLASLIPATLSRAATPRTAAGVSHNLVINAEGGIVSWGNNNNGELGYGNPVSKRWPAQMGTDSDWAEVAAGHEFSLAVKADGTLWAWGGNYYGQLGMGSADSDPHLSPVQVGIGTDWAALSAGYSHALALKSDGTLWAWGNNGSGRLGDGSTTHSYIPIQIGTDSDWIAISTGYNYSMAVKADGTLWAWGNNDDGQLGDGTITDRLSPKMIGSDTDWVFIESGSTSNHTMAIKSTGTLWGWGGNSGGKIGDGTTDQHRSPVQIGSDSDWADTAAGRDHTLAVKSDGTLWAWGRGLNGCVGDGTAEDHYSPVQIGADSDWADVDAGSTHSLALKTDGKLWAWGQRSYAGYDNPDGVDQPSPTRIGPDSDWASASAESHSLGLKTDQSLWAWGIDQGPSGYVMPTPWQPAASSSWTAADTGGFHSLSIRTDGTLWAWGSNGNGQLGDGTTSSSNEPVQAGAGSDWASCSAGERYSLGIKNDNTLWAWGDNSDGQLGIGSSDSDPHPDPVQVGADTEWTVVSAGYNHTLALKSDGSLWAWGDNWYGQLGIGSSDFDPHPDPLRVGTDNDWAAVSAGTYFSLAMKSDGTLWAWGHNWDGQLGIGSSDNDPHPDPVQVGTDTDWTMVSAGSSFSLALKSDATLWAWGDNWKGQLGTGSSDSDPHPDPVRVGIDNDWAAVSAGDAHSLAVKSDGTLWGWGTNDWGQLDNGITDFSIHVPYMLADVTTAPPAPPSWISATDGQYLAEVVVDWENVEGESGYYIYVSFFSPGANSLEGSSGLDETSWVHTYLCGTTTIYYRVTAMGPGGESLPSPEDAGSSYPCQSPPRPSNVIATQGTYSDKVVISWDDVPAEDGYNIYRADTPIAVRSLVGTVGTDVLSWDDPLPCSSATYYYSVSSYNTEGTSSESSPRVPGSTGICPPPVPTGVSAGDNLYPDRVEITWNDVSGEDGYRVYRAESAGGSYLEIGTASADTVTHNDTGFMCGGTTYYYKVAAYNAGGESALSTEDGGSAQFVNTNPAADSGGPYIAAVGEDVPLDGSGSYDPDESCGDAIVSHVWDIDDDSFYDDASGAAPVILWAEILSQVCGGSCITGNPYPVALKVTDSFAGEHTAGTTLTIYENSPVAVAGAAPNPVLCGQTISFDGTGSYHGYPGHGITAWEWDFDYDGMTFDVDATGNTADHVYATMGSYTAALRVTDDNATPITDIDTIPITVDIINQAPTADAGGPYFAVAGHGITLDASASADPDEGCGDSIVLYEWDTNYDGFTDATGQSVSMSWNDIETFVCGGTCDMEQTYAIDLTVTDGFGLQNTSTVDFNMSYLLFADDFSDGDLTGDPDWEEASGNWKVNSFGKIYTALKKNNRTLVQGVGDLDPCACASFETMFKLTKKFMRNANASIIFAYQDNANYRYVRLFKKGRRNKVQIGQVGDPAGLNEEGGVGNFRKKKLRFGKWYHLYVDVYPSGLVNVYLDNTDTPLLSHDFNNAVPGRVGYQAVKAKTYFDDFEAWHEMTLP